MAIEATSTMDKITDIVLRPAIAAGLSLVYDYFADDREFRLDSFRSPVVKDALFAGGAVGAAEFGLGYAENMLNKNITSAALKSLQRTLLEPVVSGTLFTGVCVISSDDRLDGRGVAHSFVRGASLDVFSSYLTVPLKIAFK